MFIPTIALAFAMQKEPDTWALNPVVDPKTKLAWQITVDAQSGGMEHHAKFQFTKKLKSKDDKKTITSFAWDQLEVDGQEGQEVPPWDAETGSRGQIFKMSGDVEDSYRRMLSPLQFISPEKAISMGDKWSLEIKPIGSGPKITYAYEAKKVEQIAGVAALAVSAKITEEGTDGLSGEGTWWLSRVGRVVKFEIKVKNWTVPMAGGEPVEGTLKGVAL